MYRKFQITNFMKLLLDTASILKKLKTFALTRETIALQVKKRKIIKIFVSYKILKND